MPELIQEPEASESSTIAPRKVSRRNMLMTFGIALNAIAGALFAVPVIGYVFGPAGAAITVETSVAPFAPATFTDTRFAFGATPA